MRLSLMLVGFLGAGLVGALASTMVGGPEPIRSAEAPDSPGLEPRVERIEAMLVRLEADLLKWQSEVVPLLQAARAAELPAAEPVHAAAEAPVPDGALEERMLAVLNEKEQKDREERNRRRETMLADRDSSNLASLAEKLGLTANQQEELERLLADRRKVMLALREEMFGGGMPDRSQMGAFREKMHEVVENTDEEIKSLLSADQYDTYKAQDTGPGFGRGFGGGGRGGGR